MSEGFDTEVSNPEIDASKTSWEGEAGSTETEEAPDDHVVLPVGLLKNGVNYRDVYVEEMCGIDQHLVSSKKAGNNGATAVSLVLCRCIQEIEGLLDKKQNPEKMFDRGLPRALCVPDRDYLLTRIFMLSGRNEALMAGECPRCRRVWEESVLLSKLPVIPWPEDSPREVEFKLEIGFRESVSGSYVYHKDGALRFPAGKDQEMAGGLDTPAAVLDAMVASCVVRVGTLTSVDQEMAKRLKTRDRDILMEVIQRGFPGIRQWKDVTCQCGCEYTITLDLSSFFGGRRRIMKKS